MAGMDKRPGRQTITVCAFIHRDGPNGIEVFLARRALTKTFLSGSFELPGGHVEVGEDILDALKREIRESSP